MFHHRWSLRLCPFFTYNVSSVEKRLERELGLILAALEDINERVERLKSEMTDIRIATKLEERGYEEL